MFALNAWPLWFSMTCPFSATISLCLSTRQIFPNLSSICECTLVVKSPLLSDIFAQCTVTDLANFCVTPLFRRPQGSQGCLEKRNHPLSSNLVVWCAKIGPKTKKVRKTSELTKKSVKNDGFLTVFQSFLVLGPILAHQTTKFELSG